MNLRVSIRPSMWPFELLGAKRFKGDVKQDCGDRDEGKALIAFEDDKGVVIKEPGERWSEINFQVNAAIA